MGKTFSQQKAWDILKKEEQTSLSLSLSYNKSSWKAGEILGKSHYKYLEIQSRAKQFMLMFSKYFETFPELISHTSPISWEFKDYLKLLIEKRLPIKQVILEIDSRFYTPRAVRYSMIIRDMEKLQKSSKFEDQSLFQLIKDFDRWNNFRILPLDIQEPSAYKRRNKHRSRRLIDLLMNIDELMYNQVTRTLAIKNKYANTNIYYIPLVKEYRISEAHIIKVNKIHIKKLNYYILLAFSKKIDAQEFVELLANYWVQETKHCGDGQVFWPKFREVLQRSVNHADLQNIVHSRKHITLDSNTAGLEY